jgi:hypothetical protein
VPEPAPITKPSHPNKRKPYENHSHIHASRRRQDPATSLKQNMSTVSAISLSECTRNIFKASMPRKNGKIAVEGVDGVESGGGQFLISDAHVTSRMSRDTVAKH